MEEGFVITGGKLIIDCHAHLNEPGFEYRSESAAELDIFVLAYTAFLGPIFAVLITDFYVLRKQSVNLEDLYNESGPFRGANKSAIIAIILGAAIGFINIKLSFFMSLSTAAVYYFLIRKLDPAFLPRKC